MGAWESRLWGLAGGAAAGLLSLMTAVIGNGFRWWPPDERGPRLFVLACAVLLAALVAAAAGGEMSGPWPAFVIGAGAPATLRGLLRGVEVGPKGELKPSSIVPPEVPERAEIPTPGSTEQAKEAGESVL